MISVFAEGILLQVSVKEPARESSVMLSGLVMLSKHRNRFERIIQGNDFKIKLGHGANHRGLNSL